MKAFKDLATIDLDMKPEIKTTAAKWDRGGLGWAFFFVCFW